jgi:hypothetical protein
MWRIEGVRICSTLASVFLDFKKFKIYTLEFHKIIIFNPRIPTHTLYFFCEVSVKTRSILSCRKNNFSDVYRNKNLLFLDDIFFL